MCTKRPQRVILNRVPYTRYRSEYTCPGCKTRLIDYHIDKLITRFKCSQCNQELIVEWEEKSRDVV